MAYARDVLLGTVLIPVHRAGWAFVGVLAASALVLAFVSLPLAVITAAAAAGCAFFFRDPERMTPVRPGLIVSAADGRVVAVDEAVPPRELGMSREPLTRISVFLSLFDVHVNRAPVDGVIIKDCYRRGSFRNAAHANAGDANERRSLLIDCGEGRQVAVVQIAGLLARRIVVWRGEGDTLRAGERYGMIRFGSRVDVYLPPGVAPLLAAGQRAIGGETVLADLRGEEPARQAEQR